MNAQSCRENVFRAGVADSNKEVYETISRICRTGRVSESFIRYVSGMGGDQDAARDIFQDAVLSVIEKGPSRFCFKGEAAFRKYLFTTCVRQYNQCRKREQRSRNCLLQFDQPTIEKNDPLSLLIESEERKLAEDCLEMVDSRCRRILRLWMNAFDMDEIALIEKISSRRLARKYKYRCLNRLRNCLAENASIGDR